MASLAVAVMLTGYFPYLTYAIPALAGLFTMIALIECGAFWSLGTYITISLIVLLIGESETKVLFILFFGYYPILKAIIERINSQAVEWILKLICFNIAAIASYFVSSLLFAISFDEFGEWGRYGALIFLVLCNIVFVVYDIGISRVASFYMYRLHGKIKKFIK